jgi:colanic acid/amylovoran biosynthesis glycosyltransferase
MRRDIENLGCPKEKIRVHYSGINLDKIPFFKRVPPNKNDKIKLLLVGRFVEKKGIQYALKAFVLTKKLHPNISLTIIGDGPLRYQIEQQIQSLGLTKDIILSGFQPHDEVLLQMKESHIFILPSVTAANGDKEGIPNVLKEAQASGMPVISTYHAGIPELIRNKKSGFLVKERDAYSLSTRLNQLIDNPALWSAFGKIGRKRVEEAFNLQTQIQKLEKMYKELIL